MYLNHLRKSGYLIGTERVFLNNTPLIDKLRY